MRENNYVYPDRHALSLWEVVKQLLQRQLFMALPKHFLENMRCYFHKCLREWKGILQPKTSDMVLIIILSGKVGENWFVHKSKWYFAEKWFLSQVSDMLQVTLAAPSTLSMVFFFSEHIATIFSFVLVIPFLAAQDRTKSDLIDNGSDGWGDMAWQSKRDRDNHKHRTAFAILLLLLIKCHQHPFFPHSITLFLPCPHYLCTLPSWTVTDLKSQVSSTAWPLPPLDILCK